MNVYSDVVRAGYILPKKKKYTMVDVNRVMVESLFKPFNGSTINLELAVFICKCSAVFHGTDYADSLNKAVDKFHKYPI